MSKVLGLVISARRLGNSEIMLKEIMGSIPEPCEKELIRMTDLNLKNCNACYKCLEHDGSCVLKDDYNFIMAKIHEADALLIGVPVYLLGPHGNYKVLSDRMVANLLHTPYTKGKPCAVVVPFGTAGWEGYTRTAALVMPHLLQMKLVDYWPVLATLPGESIINPANLEYAHNLGRRLMSVEGMKPSERSCPACGADLFRLLPDNMVECPICGIKGELKSGNIPYFSSLEESRFSEHHMAEHFGVWVKEMKQKFHADKDLLREIQKPYREIDWWVKPE